MSKLPKFALVLVPLTPDLDRPPGNSRHLPLVARSQIDPHPPRKGPFPLLVACGIELDHPPIVRAVVRRDFVSAYGRARLACDDESSVAGWAHVVRIIIAATPKGVLPQLIAISVNADHPGIQLSKSRRRFVPTNARGADACENITAAGNCTDSINTVAVRPAENSFPLVKRNSVQRRRVGKNRREDVGGSDRDRPGLLVFPSDQRRKRVQFVLPGVALRVRVWPSRYWVVCGEIVSAPLPLTAA